MADNINRGRMTPGLDGIPNMRLRGEMPQVDIPVAPKKVACPFGLPSCNSCKIGLNVKGKVECSIKMLAIEALKRGIDVA